jgi:membrane-associated protein
VDVLSVGFVTTDLALNPLSATDLLTSFGTVGILVVLFAETGLLIGFFLPGDSLLFTAGLLCATGAGGLRLSLPWVLVAAAAGALAGAQVGFLIGRRAGAAMRAQDRRPRVAAGMQRADELFVRYGPAKAIVLARFIPVVRTMLNPLAGALGTPARTFTLWQVVGGLVWTVGLVLAGHALGAFIPGIDAYLLPVIAVVVIVSLLPLARELLRERRRRAGAAE